MRYKHLTAFTSGFFTGLLFSRILRPRPRREQPQPTSNTVDKSSNVEIPSSMRKFSDREQRAIQLMIDGTNNDYSYLLINVYNDIFYRRQVEYQHGQDRSYLVFYRQQGTNIDHHEFLEIENEIMEISLLISYLKGCGLIYLIENTGVNELDHAGGFLKDGLMPIGMELDRNISNILFESLNHRVFVGYTLRELAANGFRSIEERTLVEAIAQTQESRNILAETRRQADAATAQAQEATAQTQTAKRQTRLSYIAILISFVAIIIGVYSNLWVARNVVMDVRVDTTTQVEEFKSRLERIEKNTDSLKYKNSIIEKRDSTNRQ